MYDEINMILKICSNIKLKGKKHFLIKSCELMKILQNTVTHLNMFILLHTQK